MSRDPGPHRSAAGEPRARETVEVAHEALILGWQRLRGHENEVWSVDFSPDGRTLATGSLDKTARLWPLGQRLIDLACASVHKLPLSQGHKQRFGIQDEWSTPEVLGALPAKLGLDKPETSAVLGAASLRSLPAG